jgi:hypothetical protein
MVDILLTDPWLLSEFSDSCYAPISPIAMIGTVGTFIIVMEWSTVCVCVAVEF